MNQLRILHLRRLGFDSAQATWLAPIVYGEGSE